MGAANARILGHSSGGGHHPNGVRLRSRREISPEGVSMGTVAAVDVEASQSQPDEVTRVLGEALAVELAPPDPWWQAGIEDALGE